MVATSKKPFLFYMLGSDPEFVFAKLHDWTPQVVPSLDVLGSGKDAALGSFIGCDAHPATGELRPAPSRTVGRHLYDVAFGLAAIEKYLYEKWLTQYKVMALPWIEPEALGGHIHVSMLFDEPDTKVAMDHNYVYHVGQLRTYHSQQPFPEIKDEAVDLIQQYAKAAAQGQRTTPELVCRVLNHLIMPFEMWIQPWSEREQRYMWCTKAEHHNASAPGNGDNANYLVRWVFSPRPKRLPDYTYMHVEYRFPSTWLVHPLLAYAYFALAKLTMVNFPLVRDLALATEPIKSSAENETFREVLGHRLEALRGQARITPDIADLDRVLRLCGESREAWWANRSLGVDFAAWRALL